MNEPIEIPLTEPTYFILLSLSLKPKHGYAIMKDVQTLSESRVILSTGTLYGALKRLLDQGWITRSDDSVALVYARSRQSTMQTGALVVGMSFSIWTALLDKAAFAGSMGDRITAPYPGTAEIAWMLQLWITWAVILLSPGLLVTFNHALQSKRAI